MNGDPLHGAGEGPESEGAVFQILPDWSEGPGLDEARGTANWAGVAAEIAGLGYWRFETAGGVFTLSDGLYRLYGLEPCAALDAQTILSRIHHDDRERLDMRLRRALDFGEPYTEKVRFCRGDDVWRVLKDSVVCRRDATGAVTTILGAVLDVTDTDTDAFRVLAESGNDILVQSDLAGRITYISPSVEAVTGYNPKEVVGMPIEALVGVDGACALDEAIQERLADPMRRLARVQYAVRHKDGGRLWLEGRPTLLMDMRSGRLLGLTDILRDVTARKIAENRLELANTLLETQMGAAPNGQLLVGADMTVISFNRRFAEMWGIPPPGEGPRAYQGVRAAIMSRVADPAGYADRVDYLYAHPEEAGADDLETLDGRLITRHSLGLRTASGDYIGRAWFFTDITEERRSLARALWMARVDELTGLANRRVFMDSLRMAVARAAPGEESLAVLYIDLDHFKDVNATLGHPVGDELLQAVAHRLRANIGNEDTLARFGGDEFAIATRSFNSFADLAALAEILIRVIAEPFTIQNTQIYTGASIGIDVHGQGAETPDTLLSHADLALYRAKARGGGAYQFFTHAMDTEARTRVDLAAELREAFAKDQLFLLYQPQVSLVTGEVTGLEALVRWRHPERGVIAPDVFIPVAEQMGLIARLGHWVLLTACRQAREWLDAGLDPRRLCVNLSAVQFKSPLALEAEILGALAGAGLAASLLELELTETVLMKAAREDGDVLRRLSQAGVAIAIDDFGTGYSSLDYLRRFPTDRVKIASTFVEHLESGSGDAAIVKATISLARELGIAVIAEGVETRKQLRLLTAWGCEEAQGYLFSRPVAAVDAGRILAKPRMFEPRRDERAAAAE